MPMGPKSEQDTTYSPVVNGRGKKEGGASRKREFGTNGEKEKLMIIENVSRNKGKELIHRYYTIKIILSITVSPI